MPDNFPKKTPPGAPVSQTVLGLREVIDANRSKIIYRANECKPLSVTYADGAVAEFTWDQEENLSGIRQRDGLSWERTGNPDRDGFCQWRSPEGHQARLRFVVLPDGTYQREDPSGTIETTTPAAKRFVANPFHPDFNPQQELLSIFNVIDKNRDGTLSRNELDQALIQVCTNPGHLRLVSMIRLYFDDIIATRDDPMLIEAGGVTLEDMTKFEKRKLIEQKKLTEPPPHFLDLFAELFQSIDLDRDGMTCIEDIEQMFLATQPQALISIVPENDVFREQMKQLGGSLDPLPSVSKVTLGGSRVGQDSLLCILARFVKKQKSLEAYGLYDRADWIYKKTFVQICNDALRDHAEAQAITGGWFFDEQRSVMAVPRNLFADPENPVESLRVDAVRQGAISDTLFVATLAGLVAASPPLILRSMSQVPGKSCTVTFAGAPGEAITMAWLTNLELALYITSTDWGIWSAFLQKAYETHLTVQHQARSRPPATEVDWSAVGNLPFELLTGQRGIWLPLWGASSEEDIRNRMGNSLSKRLPIVISSGPQVHLELTDLGVYAGHVLSVIRFNKDTNQVTLRDPLSTKKGAPGSTDIVMSLDKVLQQFHSIYL